MATTKVAIVNEHEIIIVENEKVVDVVFSLSELKEKYGEDIEVKWER